MINFELTDESVRGAARTDIGNLCNNRFTDSNYGRKLGREVWGIGKIRTDDRLSYLNRTDKTMIIEWWRGKAEVCIGCWSVQRVNVSGESQTMQILRWGSTYREGQIIEYLMNRAHLEYFPYTLCVASTVLTPRWASSSPVLVTTGVGLLSSRSTDLPEELSCDRAMWEKSKESHCTRASLKRNDWRQVTGSDGAWSSDKTRLNFLIRLQIRTS